MISRLLADYVGACIRRTDRDEGDLGGIENRLHADLAAELLVAMDLCTVLPDKDVFIAHCQSLLARRILADRPVNVALERILIEKLTVRDVVC